jgi:prevent-host-death family protein
MTLAEVQASLTALIDDVESGDEIEITRDGVVVARLVPARRPSGLKNKFAGVATSSATDEELFSVGEHWEIFDDGLL